MNFKKSTICGGATMTLDKLGRLILHPDIFKYYDKQFKAAKRLGVALARKKKLLS